MTHPEQHAEHPAGEDSAHAYLRRRTLAINSAPVSAATNGGLSPQWRKTFDKVGKYPGSVTMFRGGQN
jgi:hypothetical protein